MISVWYSGAAVVTMKKGNSITTSNSPSFTLLDSSYRLMWNSPSCSTEGWMNRGSVRQAMKVCPSLKTLCRWINVSWAPAPWLTETKHWFQHSSRPLQLTKSDSHQIRLERSLCSDTSTRITWTRFVCCQHTQHIAQCYMWAIKTTSENLHKQTEANIWCDYRPSDLRHAETYKCWN